MVPSTVILALNTDHFAASVQTVECVLTCTFPATHINHLTGRSMHGGCSVNLVGYSMYELIEGDQTWEDAKLDCESMNGTLIRIESGSIEFMEGATSLSPYRAHCVLRKVETLDECLAPCTDPSGLNPMPESGCINRSMDETECAAKGGYYDSYIPE